MEESISRILSEVEEIRHLDNPTTQLSEPALLDLQTLLDSNDSELLDRLFDGLSSKSLSLPNHLVRPIASAMDSGPTHLSLLASKVYLSLLLSPNAPVFTLFTPMSFLTLFRSIRRSLKRRTSAPPTDTEGSHVVPARRKQKGGGARDKGLRKNARNSYSESEESEFDVGDLFPVLERLELVMGLIHLDRFPDSLKSLVQTVVEIPVMAVELCGNSAGFNRLIELCSRVLSEVLRPEHGEQADTAAEVLKSLSQLILRLKSPARTFALGFVTNGVKKAVVNFPRYLAQKAPEKSEPRALAVESIMEIVKVMEFEDRIGFVEYVVKMTQGKANLRLLAVDLILMLMMSLRDPLGVGSGIEVKDSWGLRCLEALILRCSDTSTTIRARALSNLAQLLGFLANDNKSRAVLKEVMGFGDAGEQILEGGMNDLLRKRCTDEKAAVRKSALVLISKLTALLGGAFDGALLKSMGIACSDPLVSIRKAAISALSEVS